MAPLRSDALGLHFCENMLGIKKNLSQNYVSRNDFCFLSKIILTKIRIKNKRFIFSRIAVIFCFCAAPRCRYADISQVLNYSSVDFGRSLKKTPKYLSLVKNISFYVCLASSSFTQSANADYWDCISKVSKSTSEKINASPIFTQVSYFAFLS